MSDRLEVLGQIYVGIRAELCSLNEANECLRRTLQIFWIHDSSPDLRLTGQELIVEAPNPNVRYVAKCLFVYEDRALNGGIPKINRLRNCVGKVEVDSDARVAEIQLGIKDRVLKEHTSANNN